MEVFEDVTEVGAVKEANLEWKRQAEVVIGGKALNHTCVGFFRKDSELSWSCKWKQTAPTGM